MADLQLLKKWANKGELALYIKGECLRLTTGKPQQLHELLNYLLDPTKELKDAEKFELIDWCKWLISGGVPFQEYQATVQQYDNAIVCGLVWTADFVAYRCRTCAVSPCMSLCADCFQAADHKGHDYNMFRSQAGGACDCGDVNVMKESGFCPRHGPEHAKKQVAPPTDLMVVAEAMIPRLLYRLILYMRQQFDERPEVAMKDAEPYVAFLHELSNMGAAMRHIITKTVSDTQLYKQFLEGAAASSCSIEKESADKHIIALGTLIAPDVPSDFRDVEGLDAALEHQTLLDELVFWMVKFEFPQDVVTFLLSILPDDDYKVKEVFTKSFVKHYSRIFTMLIKANGRQQRQQISNRVVHISVQLLSPQTLATKMVTEDKLMYIMLASLKYMMQLVLTSVDHVSSFHSIVDCNSDILKDHCYWPIISDIINVLSHKHIAHEFMSSEKLLHFWFELISFYQGMNVNKRELIAHVEFEPDSYYAAFSAELEICASPMWSMLAHCKAKGEEQFSRNVIKIIIEEVEDWFDANSIDTFTVPPSFEVSFHLPLHRCLAVFLSNAVMRQGIPLDSVLPSHQTLEKLMMHPLHIQVIFTEIFAGMWVRNGLQIRGQAMTYVQCHFANSMIDADLFLLQICAARLDPDHFISTIMDRYHANDLLTFAPCDDKYRRAFFDTDHYMPMIEGALTLLNLILTFRTQIGMTEAEITRHDMVTLLCMADRTHSQLLDMMPEKCGLSGQNKDFDAILKEVSDYKAPNFEAGGMMQQGMYVPKGFVWENEFDPLHAQLRAMHRRDYQSSLDRYTTYVKNNGLYKGAATPWPPFRPLGHVHEDYAMLRKVLHCRTMHAILLILLHKALNDKTCSDAMLYLTVNLLDMAVSVPSPGSSNREVPVGDRHDKKLRTWYSTDCIFKNVREVIPEVIITLSGEMALKELQQSLPGDQVEPADLLEAGGYQLAPSTMSSSGSFLTSHSTSAPGHSAMMVVPQGTSPEILSAVQAMLDEATNQVEVVTGLMEHQGQSTNHAPVGRNHGNQDGLPAVRSQGVSVNLESIKTSKSQPINESILTLLVKLHAKLSGKNNSYIPESQRAGTSSAQSGVSDSKIGDGPFHLARLIDKICRFSTECSEVVESMCTVATPRDRVGKGKRKDISDKDERRRRVQERQKKLMADFANKQKEFMEKVIHETSDMDLDEDQPEEHRIMEEKLYDCVICNQTTMSTEERPVGLVTLLQPTSVLGHRSQSTEPYLLPVTETMATHQKVKNCAEIFHDRMMYFKYEFDENSCLMSLNIGWQGGVYAQTCGHHIHLDCQASYVEALKTQQQQGLQTSKGEYWCPLCRQLANTALPISPGVGAAISKPIPASPRYMIKRLSEMLLLRPLTAGASLLTRAMHQVMEDIHKVTYPQYKQYSRSQSPESILLFVCSVLRTNLEAEVLQRGGFLTLPPVALAPKNSCVLAVYQVLSLHSKMVTPQPFTNLWSHITGVCDSDPSNQSLTLFQQEVPVLLKDASALFIELLLSLPVTMEKEIFQCLVFVIYNLVYIQALSCMTCRFTEEERIAWKNKNRQTASESLEGWMSAVIQYLSCSPLYDDDDADSLPNVPAICQSVWSPQSVETCIQEYCLPYLHMVALLQHHLYEEPLPQVNRPTVDIQEEFSLLVRFLELAPSNKMDTMAGGSQGAAAAAAGGGAGVVQLVKAAECLHWYCENPLQLVQGWNQHFVQFVKRRTFARRLLAENTSWCMPKLVGLARDYDRIFQYYRKQRCSKCNSLPHDPAVCLICGKLVCFKEDCCKSTQATGENAHECVQHSIDCGAGTGIYLVVNSSLVIVIRGSRAAVWGSVYLDEHGEEDKDLRRGKPLYLSEARYKMLQQQWVTMSFDRVCKRWIFHQGKL